MSDKIREAFEYELKKGWPQQTPSMWPMFESGWNAGYTSRDAEISELVEALENIAKYEEDDRDSGWLYIVQPFCSKAKNAIEKYTKTPCPECGGKKTVCNYEHSKGVDVCLKCKTCHTCQGRGYKWERKG